MSTINSDLLVLHLIKHLIRKSEEMSSQTSSVSLSLPPQDSENFIPQLRLHLLQQIQGLERTLNSFKTSLQNGEAGQEAIGQLADLPKGEMPGNTSTSEAKLGNASNHNTNTAQVAKANVSFDLFREIAFVEAEHVGELLPGGFVIEEEGQNAKRNFYWASEQNKKIYLVAINILGDASKIETTSLMVSFLLNEVAAKLDNGNASDLMREFERRFATLRTRYPSAVAEELRVSTLVLDKLKAKIEFCGLGMDFYQVVGKKLSKFEGRKEAIKQGARGNTENHELTMGRNQSYYIFASDTEQKLHKVFEENIKKLANRDTDERKLNLTQKVQDTNTSSQAQDFLIASFGL